MMRNKLRSNAGLSLVEVMVAIALIAIFVTMAMSFVSHTSQNNQRTRNTGTQNRILAGIRELARLPASLRTSMRAANNGVAVNPQLLACAGGGTPNGCQNDVETPFALYHPVYPRNATGTILGVQPISAPLNSPQPFRMDSYGVPCSTAGPDCALLVYTSFRAQCGPQQVASIPATVTADELNSTANCTVADVIIVTYYVQLDPAITNADPSLASFINQTTGSVSVSVRAISGNFPQ